MGTAIFNRWFALLFNIIRWGKAKGLYALLKNKTNETKQGTWKRQKKKNRKTPAVLKTQQDDGKAIDFLYFVTVEC